MREVIIVSEKPENENQVHITKITELMSGSVDKLIVNDALDHIANRVEGLKILVSKLRYEGIIEIRGIDILEIARDMYTCRLTIAEANNLLYDGRESCDSIIGVLELLQKFGLTIMVKQVDNHTYFVRAERTRNVQGN